MRFDVGARRRAARSSACRGGCARSEPLPPPNARAGAGTWGWGRGAWEINGKGFDHGADGRAAATAAARSAWTFANRSNRVHPMHIHGFLFRVLRAQQR